MGRHAGITLSSTEQKQLKKLMHETKNKNEYRACQGLLLRAEGTPTAQIAHRLNVTQKQVFVWTRKFRKNGTNALRVKKQTGRPATKAKTAKQLIEKMIDEDPQVFGYLKGRWVLRDISSELKKRGVQIHFTSVGRILDDLNIGLKSPKLRAPGSIRKNYRKREQIRRYKKIAPALFKKKSLSHSRTKNGRIYYQSPSDAGRAKVKRDSSARSDTPNA